ncbi:MAG: polysaccharide deacetylase family protein [Lachnospiraceae bacterium]|nr:polysaccharide deacetylase family protein [Lachnospiraceae bacterium]
MAELCMRFPEGKGKCLTFSYDDGVVNDLRLAELFEKKGLKCTFNLNSGTWTDRDYDDYRSVHRRLTLEKAKALYTKDCFEVASHAVTHPHLEKLPAAVCTKEILDDVLAHEKAFGGTIRGFAYPFGTWNDTAINSLKACGIVYARTVWSSHNFELPKDWLVLRPTCHHEEAELPKLTERFLEKEGPWPDIKLFYVWGHSYEFDFHNNWEIIEDFTDKVSGRDDIWYATNIEIYDYVKAYENLIFNATLTEVTNLSSLDVWFVLEGKEICVGAGKTVKL